MLQHKDATTDVRQPKSARMEQRIQPRVKEKISEAAALLGVDESTFVSSAAYKEAETVILNHERTSLTTEDSALILAALDAPANPSKALTDAFRAYRERNPV